MPLVVGVLPGGVGYVQPVNALYYNAGAGQDQLRQRVIYALSQVWVVALNKNTNADMIVPHLQILSRNAFGNYRTLMREMTLKSLKLRNRRNVYVRRW